MPADLPAELGTDVEPVRTRPPFSAPRLWPPFRFRVTGFLNLSSPVQGDPSTVGRRNASVRWTSTMRIFNVDYDAPSKRSDSRREPLRATCWFLGPW